MTKLKTYDVAVVGAGVFGAWIALYLARRGQRVLLLDAYGAAHSRASSGGESRIIRTGYGRMGYGADELYTRWAVRSLAQWKELFGSGSPPLFHETGVLWLTSEKDAPLEVMTAVLTRCKVPFEVLDRGAIEQRYSQFNPEGLTGGVLETTSGVLMGRRAVAEVVQQAIGQGVDYRTAMAVAPEASLQRGKHGLDAVSTNGGEQIRAGQFVFACGAWMGKVFPQILGPRIFPTRQEVFFFGVPPGDTQFSPPSLPTWLIAADETYGVPNLETRGFKVAIDGHGERADPDTQSRVVSAESVARVSAYVAKRFPALRNAPVVETRVCQYENTSNGDFLIDRHPEWSNVWFAGGGSGHGFKHGPMVGEYVAQQLLDGDAAEPRFALMNKGTEQKRAVY
jgi:monomeric sarcosine oxidase